MGGEKNAFRPPCAASRAEDENREDKAARESFWKLHPKSRGRRNVR
jgi:hypothetical protein